jgi:hypothetical protein
MSRFDVALTAVLVTGLVVMGILVWLVSRTAGTRQLPRVVAFRCPVIRRTVVAEFEVDGKDAKPVEVSWCTAFRPAVTVLCKKRCLLGRIGRRRDEVAPLAQAGEQILETVRLRPPDLAAHEHPEPCDEQTVVIPSDLGRYDRY